LFTINQNGLLNNIADLKLQKNNETTKNAEEVSNTNTSQTNNNKKSMALIVVNNENEKSIYTELINREQNFDFGIDIVSLKESKINNNPKNIKKFL